MATILSLVVRTFKIYSLNNFEIYNTVLLAISQFIFNMKNQSSTLHPN